MNRPTEPPAEPGERLETLLLKWQDRSITASELEELVRHLELDPAARAQLFEDFLLTNAVRETLAGEPSREAAPRVRARSVTASRRAGALFPWGLSLAAAAAAVAAVVILAPGGARRPSEADARRRLPEPAAQVASSSPVSDESPVAPAGPALGSDALAALPEPPSESPEAGPLAEDAEPRGMTRQEVQEAQEVQFSAPGSGAGHLAYVDAREGVLERAVGEGREWSLVPVGTGLSAGERLRTRFSRARIVYETGSVLYIDRFTTLALCRADDGPASGGVEMVGGKIYIELARAVPGFFVDTPHARAVDLGTRFGVESTPLGTTVLVVDGRVQVATDAGRTEAAANQEVVVARRTSPPGEPRPARDPAGRLAWTRRLRPPAEAAPLPAEPPAGEPALAVVSLTLVDADADAPVKGFDPLPDGSVIDFGALAAQGVRAISVRANTRPQTVGSVVFQVDGRQVNIENTPPYSIAATHGSDYEPWVVPPGAHRITAIPYAQSAGRGEQGRALTVTVRVVGRTGR